MKRVVATLMTLVIVLSIFWIFTSQAKAASLPPVGYWKFDEGSGTTAADSSGNGNTGTVNGAQWVEGIEGKALSFDGLDDYVYVPHSSSLDLDGYQMSVEFWMKLELDWHPGIAHENMCVYDKGNAYTSSLIAVSGALRYNLAYVPVRETPETTKSDWASNTWFFIAEVYDDPYIKIYVNGLLDNSENVSGPIPHSGYNLCIGAHSLRIDQIWFNGTIDELAIYNYARTPEEIWNDYISLAVPSVEIPIKGGENATISGNVTITNAHVTKNTLHFEAFGPTGSTGWINITFPMVNTTEIKVFINNVKLTPPPFPIITTNGTHYFIYFEFTLSTHSIDIQFGPTAVGGISIPVDKLSLLAPYIGLTILLAATVVAVVYVKKRKRNTQIGS